MCVFGRHWSEIHAELIRGMWEVYPDTPKFHVSQMDGGHADSWHNLAEHDTTLSTLLLHLLDRAGWRTRPWP